jgi:hypothetical protein
MLSGASKRGQFSAAYTINMSGFDFRQAQESLVHTRSLADFITNTSGCRFSVRTTTNIAESNFRYTQQSTYIGNALTLLFLVAQRLKH